jgi:hypothetical protein
LTPFDQKWQAAIKRLPFLGVSANDNSNIGWYEGCPCYWFLHCYLRVSSCTSFSSLQLGAEASSWMHLATTGALIKPLWREFSWIQLQ